MIDKHYYIYDAENYPNFFLLGFISHDTEKTVQFEISDRCNDTRDILKYFQNCKKNKKIVNVGFNNNGYDHPLCNWFFRMADYYADRGEYFDDIDKRNKLLKHIFAKTQSLINTDWDDRFSNQVKYSDVLWKEVDLMKINHFDNKQRRVSLKTLEFVMRMDDIQELPFPPGTWLDSHQMDVVAKYNIHDLRSTRKFFIKCLPMFEFREKLSQQYNMDMSNYSDAKIGSEIFIKRLQENGIKCFTKENGKRVPIQTIRKKIKLGDVILPTVNPTSPEFKAITNWYRNKTITRTKEVFSKIPESEIGELIEYGNVRTLRGGKDEDGFTTYIKRMEKLNVVFNELEFDFGTGGLHGSVHKQTISADNEYVICDIDVEGYYPSFGIANEFFPKHLTKKYCDIALEIKEERKKYPKGTDENTSLKLSGNATYGNSNNRHSCIYDPAYTMSITINGQLFLCLLCEALSVIGSLSLIQVNTDGITVKLWKGHLGQFRNICRAWEKYSKLKLEENFYSLMHIRDVNNYIAVYRDKKDDNGNPKIKRKGAYEYQPEMHKDHSALVVKMAAEHYVVHGTPVDQYIHNHADFFDFFLCTKINKSDYLYGEIDGEEEELQRITRYYIAKSGMYFFKHMPPLAKSKNPDKWRKNAIQKDYYCQPMNKITDEDVDYMWDNLNYDWYIKKANDLVSFDSEDFEKEET